MRERSGERTPRRTSARVSSEQDGTSPTAPSHAAAGSEPRNTSIRIEVSSRTTGLAASVDHALALALDRPQFLNVIRAGRKIWGSPGRLVNGSAQACERAVLAGGGGQVRVDCLPNQRRFRPSYLPSAVDELAILIVVEIDLSAACDVRSIHHTAAARPSGGPLPVFVARHQDGLFTVARRLYGRYLRTADSSLSTPAITRRMSCKPADCRPQSSVALVEI